MARLHELPSGSLPYIHRLIEARLLVADHRDGVDVVEIAHESLLRQWPDLARWLETASADLKVAERVTWAAREWDSNKRRIDWLEHHGARLQAAERVARQPLYRDSLAGQEADYLRACRARLRVQVGRVVGTVTAFLVVGGLRVAGLDLP